MSDSSSSRNPLAVSLDGHPVIVPHGGRSVGAIRSYLEVLASQQHRILCSFHVDGESANLNHWPESREALTEVAAETMTLDEIPLQLIERAMRQTAEARNAAAAVARSVQNDWRSRDFWWDLTQDLKRPLMTLTLLPRSESEPGVGGATGRQLLKWQLEQFGSLLNELHEACWSERPNILADVLRNRALPWLDAMQRSLELQRETQLAAQAAA